MAITHKIYFRFAEPGDIPDLFRWKNDPATRKASFCTDEVSLDDHQRWFFRSASDPMCNIFIVLDDAWHKVGQIRFNRYPEMVHLCGQKESRAGKLVDSAAAIAEIDITIDPGFRSKGYGTIVLEQGCRMYLDNFSVDGLKAKIRTSNTASIRAFEKAGFVRIAETDTSVEMRLMRMQS